MSPSEEVDLVTEWDGEAERAFLDAGLVTTLDALPVQDGPFDFWVPPQGNAAADWDREVGGAVDRILLSGGESTDGVDRAVLKGRISELPRRSYR